MLFAGTNRTVHNKLGVHIAGFHHIQIIYHKTSVNKVIIKLSLIHCTVLYNIILKYSK